MARYFPYLGVERVGRMLRVLTRHIGAALLLAIAAPAAHASDNRYTYPQQFSVSPKGVNMQTGRLIYRKTDLTIGPLNFVRSWSDDTGNTFGLIDSSGTRIHSIGLETLSGRLPYGWLHSFNQGVLVDTSGSSTKYKIYVDSRQFQFIVLSDGNIVPNDKASQGTYLVMVNGNWNFTDKSGNIYYFATNAYIISKAVDNFDESPAQAQLLSRAVYADGSTIDYVYNNVAQPHLVSSNRGYAIVIDYDTNNNVSTVCGYNAAQTYVSSGSTCVGATLKVNYGYDASSRLTSVTDVSGHVVNITYAIPTSNLPALPTCITLPNSSVCEIQNAYGDQPGDPVLSGTNTPCCTHPDQVRVQTTAGGNIWRYVYEPDPDANDQPVVFGQPRYTEASMTDPLGASTILTYDRGRLVQSDTPGGVINYRYATVYYTVQTTSTIQLEYHDNLPGLVTMPSGNRDYFEHDLRGNVTTRSSWPAGAPDPVLPDGSAFISSDSNIAKCCISASTPVFPAGSVTVHQTFMPSWGAIGAAYGTIWTMGCGSGPADAKLCDKPLTQVDANGNTTDYTYDQATGNVLTETAPAVNGVRAQTRYTYAQRYAWVKTAGGGYTQAATPVWVLTQTSICKSGAASGAGCAVAGDEIRTTYDYGPDSGPNNLLLRGVVNDAGGAALRTCYGYDAQGNKISETKPRAGLTVCP